MAGISYVCPKISESPIQIQKNLLFEYVLWSVNFRMTFDVLNFPKKN